MSRLYSTTPEADAVFSQALNYIEQNKPSKAVEVLLPYAKKLMAEEQNASIKDSLIRCYELLSKAYIEMKEWHMALNHAGYILDLNDKSLAAMQIKAEVHRELGDLSYFEHYAKKACELDKNNAQYLETLAYDYYNMRQYTKANELAKEILSIKPQSYAAFTVLSITERCLGNLEAADKYFQEAVNISPDCDDIYRETGKLLFTTDQESEGVEMIEKAYRLNPDNSATVICVADMLSKYQQDDKAIEMLKNLIEVKPKEYYAYILLSSLLHQDNKINEAERYADQAIELRPFQPEGYYYKGVCNFSRGLVSKAIPPLLKAIDLDSKYLESYRLLTPMLINEGRIDEAIKYLDRGLDSIEHPSLLFQKGMCFIMKLELDEAENIYKDALAKFPDNDELLMALATVYHRVKKSELIPEILDKISSKDDDFYYLQGVTLYNQGKVKESLEAFLNVAQDGSQRHRNTLICLGSIYAELKNFDQAEMIFDYLIDMNPDVGMNYISKTRLYFEMGRYEEALETVESAYIADKLVVDQCLIWKIECLKKLGREEEVAELSEALKSMDVEATENAATRNAKHFGAMFKPLSEHLDDMQFPE